MSTTAKRSRAAPRQRISLACNTCRVKRTKCDGGQPQCTACSNREDRCEYAHNDSKRKPPSKQYVHALQARIENLEQRLAQFTANNSNVVPSSRTLGQTRHRDERQIRHSNAPASLQVTSPAASSLDKSTPPYEPVEDLVDTLGRFNIGDGGELRYFGSRSNFSLLHGRMAHETYTHNVRAQGYDAAQRLVGIVDVSDELCNHLLDLFWRWQNTWQYLVPQQLFLQGLKDDKQNRFCSPLLLSSVLALASRYSDRTEVRTDPDNSVTAGEPFAAPAKVMLQYECEAPTTTTVQAAALLSLWETSRDKESLGWMYCGMATRMAFNLGLHLDCSRCVTSGLLTQEDAEARNVTWWGCYVLDKLFNVGLGRPATILDRDITAEQPSVLCDLEYSPWLPSLHEKAGPFTPISRCVTNARYTCEFFRIISEVLDEVYAPRIGWTKLEKKDRVTKSHLQLVAFYNRLPSFLKISPSSQQPALPHTYQLHLQYHVAMILLHRPFLKALHSGEFITGLVSDEEDMHSRACRASAEWISNIFRIYRANYTLRRIPISAVHCAFTAAIIHLVDATSPDLVLCKKAQRRLRICVSSLHDMSIAWAWSKRSILALQLLVKEWNVDVRVLGEDATSTDNLQTLRDGGGTQSATNDLNGNETGGAQSVNPPDDQMLDVGWLFDDIFGQNMDPLHGPMDNNHSDLDYELLDEFEPGF